MGAVCERCAVAHTHDVCLVNESMTARTALPAPGDGVARHRRGTGSSAAARPRGTAARGGTQRRDLLASQVGFLELDELCSYRPTCEEAVREGYGATDALTSRGERTDLGSQESGAVSERRVLCGPCATYGSLVRVGHDVELGEAGELLLP